MTPQEFAAKWKASELRERAGAQSHFDDLCRLLGERTPAEAAVAAAYGWPADLAEDAVLARLLALNLERAAQQT